jgi:hypothetical protein
MIDQVINVLIGVLLWAINLVIRALNDVIHFIVTTISKVLKILRLLAELIFYLLPFGEVVYIGQRKHMLWLTIVGSVFIGIFFIALLHALARGGRNDDAFDNEAQYVSRDMIFVIFVILNLMLGAIVGFLYFNIQLPMKQ